MKFTKDQVKKILEEAIKEENGLNDVLQMVLNALMHAEREGFLLDNPTSGNKANGYRQGFAVSNGKQLELNVPRDRKGLFYPVIYALMKDQDAQMRSIAFELYSKGLTTRDVGSVMERIYGKKYSAQAISHISNEFKDELHEWRNRPLQKYYKAVYIDALYTKVRRDDVSNEAFYVVLGVTPQCRREVLAVVNMPSESPSGWKEVMEDLRDRGVRKIGLVISDDLKGINDAILQVFPHAAIQKCVVHLQRYLLRHVRSKDKKQVNEDFQKVFNLNLTDDDKEAIMNRLESFSRKWGKIYPEIEKLPKKEGIEHYFTYLGYSYHIRRMIYTTNWIERLNRSFKKVLRVRGALPDVESALTLISAKAREMEESTYAYPIKAFAEEAKFEFYPEE